MATQFSRLWGTLQAAAGIKWQLLGVFVSIVLARADWISKKLIELNIIEGGNDNMIFGFPSWILGLTSALGFLAIWFFAYAHKLRVKIQISRVELSTLRKRGVELRNKGRSELNNNADWEAWKKETLEWYQKVYKRIKEISVADAEWFDTMDVVPPPRLDLLKPINQDTHPARYEQHDFQVARLGKMIRDLWGK